MTGDHRQPEQRVQAIGGPIDGLTITVRPDQDTYTVDSIATMDGRPAVKYAIYERTADDEFRHMSTQYET